MVWIWQLCVCIHSINREVSVLRSYLQCVGRNDHLFQISKENLPYFKKSGVSADINLH